MNPFRNGIRVYARARPRRTPGTMNGLEREYELHLRLQRNQGAIVDYDFESVKLKLADRTFYTPDFCVETSAGFIEMHEVKGANKSGPLWEDDARVKIKIADRLHPFRFVAVWKGPNGWEREVIGE